MFLLEIKTDGDAFTDGCALREISRILHQTARAIRDGNDTRHVVVTSRDSNGNACAVARYIPEPAAGTCSHCDGTGTRAVSYGGDGFGNRCAAIADGETPCDECDGTGRADKGEK